MKNVTVSSHPLVQHHLTRLRDGRTPPEEFRRVLNQLSLLLIYEATQTFRVKPRPVKTPVAPARGFRLQREVVLVPVLRAGLGMMEAVLQLLPEARVGFIGLKREEITRRAVGYHKSLPKDLSAFEVVVIDPMLATGGSAVAALDLIFEHGARRVRLMNVIAAPEGIRRVQQSHPKVPIFTAVVDRRLNAKAYIVPGLGDAGDRQFGL